MPSARQARTADVYCFSPYFTGSRAQFQRLSTQAHFLGLQICRHTHGELGITAAACHHILLTLHNVVDGNQQTAHMMTDDILTEVLPIANGRTGACPPDPGSASKLISTSWERTTTCFAGMDSSSPMIQN